MDLVLILGVILLLVFLGALIVARKRQAGEHSR